MGFPNEWDQVMFAKGKYINILADYYGAKIRNMGEVEFRFPEPMQMKTSDGRAKRVYPGNVQIPEYAPTHTAPELDIVDIITSYLEKG